MLMSEFCGMKIQERMFFLQFWRKYFGQSKEIKEIKQNCLVLKHFDVYLCLIFDHYYQSFISGTVTGHWALYLPNFEIF